MKSPNPLRIFIAGAVLLSLYPVSAAEPLSYPISAPAAELPVYDQAGFDWSGFYAGVFGVAQSGGTAGDGVGAGVELGVNLAFDFYLVGAEVAVQGLASDDGAASGQVVGRAGLIVTDDVVAYAAAGYGIDLDSPNEDRLLVGGGLEVVVSDDVSVNAQYMHGFEGNDGGGSNQFTLGARFHF